MCFIIHAYHDYDAPYSVEQPLFGLLVHRFKHIRSQVNRVKPYRKPEVMDDSTEYKNTARAGCQQLQAQLLYYEAIAPVEKHPRSNHSHTNKGEITPNQTDPEARFPEMG